MTLTSCEHRIFSRSFAQSDASNDDNIIRNVSVITIGPALGHDCYIDAETLSGLLEASKRFKNGVRANLGHFTGMENSFGHITRLHISGDKLLGDLNLFPEHKDFALIKKNIATIPDTFGFSVFFDGPDEEVEKEVDGAMAVVKFARCEPGKFYSVDLVTTQAANPSGVFHREFIQGPTVRGQTDTNSVDTKKKDMDDNMPDMKKMISDCMAECMKPHMERMDEISKKVDALAIGTNDTPVKTDEGAADLLKKEGKEKDSSPNLPLSDEDEKKKMEEAEKEKEKEMSRRIEANNKALRAEIVGDVMKAFADQKISPPASATAGSPAPEKNGADKPKYTTFHEACRGVHALSDGKSKVASMKLAEKQYPDLHKAFCLAQENGEAWTRESLFMTPEKKQRNLSIIASGRLI